MGSDNVNRALNKLLKHYNDKGNKDAQEEYKNNQDIKEEYKKDIEIIGQLFLAIRRDLGNRKTKLKPSDMLRGQITDIDKYI